MYVAKICTITVLHRGNLSYFCGGIPCSSVLEGLNRFWTEIMAYFGGFLFGLVFFFLLPCPKLLVSGY